MPVTRSVELSSKDDSCHIIISEIPYRRGLQIDVIAEGSIMLSAEDVRDFREALERLSVQPSSVNIFCTDGVAK